MKAFVDFYKQEKISPVSQDISDLEKHFRRRNALYRHLGIVPAFVRGLRVLEFGPGSGHNSVHTASLEPGKYTLVEANPTGIESIRALFDEHLEDQSNIQIVESLIEDYRSDDPFDIVLCEGLLPLQEDPISLLQHVAGFVAPGGALVITCTDAVGYVAEQLRRLVAAVLTTPTQSTGEKLDILMPVFSPQLAQIEGMSRPHKDYILDNIIQPFGGRHLIGMDQAIDAVADALHYYGVSPHFVTDWRWYKKIVSSPSESNTLGRNAYLDNVHNFLDSRTLPTAPDRSRNLELLDTCNAVFADIINYDNERDDAILDRIDANLDRVADLVAPLESLTEQSIRQFQVAFRNVRDGKSDLDWGRFADWFGQAQLYVSFLKYG